MNDLLSRFGFRDPRVVILAVAVLIVGLILIWRPLAQSAETLRQSVQEQRSVLEWMRASSGEVDALRKHTANRSDRLDGQSLIGAIDSSAKELGLAQGIKQMDPQDDNSVRVWVEGIAFDELLKWLGHIREQHGIAVSDLGVSRASDGEGVNARLTLNASGDG